MKLLYHKQKSSALWKTFLLLFSVVIILV